MISPEGLLVADVVLDLQTDVLQRPLPGAGQVVLAQVAGLVVAEMEQLVRSVEVKAVNVNQRSRGPH